MPLFVTTKAAATRHGVYGVEKIPAALVRATGTGTAALIEQQSWGPSQSLFTGSLGELLMTFAPPGMNRTNAGYLAMIKKGFPILKVVRVLGSSAVIASATINKTGPTALIVVTLKYAGTEGNNVVITTSAAQDGDANHFNITASVTGASGTYSETVNNWNVSGVGADSALTQAQKNQLRLIGTITKSSAGVPIIGSTTCSGGTNGTIDGTTYVGTAGTGDVGAAKLEGDKTIDHFFTGDPGNSYRAVVNAGLKAHADLMTDRIAYLNGNAANTAAQAQTDVANYRSQRVVYTDPYVYLYDDVDGTKRLVTSAAFAASVASRLPPSTSIAWKSDVVQDMLSGIVELEASRGEATAANTAAGIATFIQEDEGGFTIEADVTSIAPVTPAKKNLTRSRTGIFIARSVQKSLRGSVDMPNLPVYQQDIIDAVTTFLETLKQNGKKDDAVFVPHILDYALGDISADNAQTDLDNGDFSIPADIKTSPGMERIFLNANYGPTVQPTVTAT